MSKARVCLSALGALLLSALLAAQSTMFQSQNLAAGPIGWWKLCGDTSAASGCSASSSTVVYDSASGHNNLTWNGAPSGTTNWYAAGHVGPWAGAFDGSTDYAQGSDTGYPSGASPRSVTGWIYPTNFNSAEADMFFYGTKTTNKMMLIYLSTGKLCWSQFGGGICSPATLPLSTWSFFAFTFDGSAWTEYVNGASVASGAVTTNTVLGGTTEIGYGQTAHFPGRIDDVRLYNRALPAGEIAAMYLAHN